MFCVLNVRRRENTFTERLFGRFIKDDYSLKTVPVLKGAPFFVLTATVGKNGADWEMVESLVGKCAKRLLVQEGISLPNNDNIGVFKSNMLYKKIAENTFVEILRNNRINKSPKTVCISDNRANNTAFLSKISHYAKELNVITSAKEKYDEASSNIMKDSGLTVSFLSSRKNEQIFIDLDNSTMNIRCENGVLNIANGSDFTVPEIYRSLLPNGIDKYDFYSALYELCGVFAVGECIFSDIEVNNEKRCVDSIHFT